MNDQLTNKHHRSWRVFFVAFFSVAIASFARNQLEKRGIHIAIALFVTHWPLLLIVYFIPPRPQIGFYKFMITATLWIGFVISCLLWFPALLASHIPSWFAYFLLAMFCGTVSFGIYQWLCRMRGEEIKFSFQRWGIWMICFAIVWAFLHYTSTDSPPVILPPS